MCEGEAGRGGAACQGACRASWGSGVGFFLPAFAFESYEKHDASAAEFGGHGDPYADQAMFDDEPRGERDSYGPHRDEVEAGGDEGVTGAAKDAVRDDRSAIEGFCEGFDAQDGRAELLNIGIG